VLKLTQTETVELDIEMYPAPLPIHKFGSFLRQTLHPLLVQDYRANRRGLTECS
jgi:hypothetical protein